jgi:hypothetical protein
VDKSNLQRRECVLRRLKRGDTLACWPGGGYRFLRGRATAWEAIVKGMIDAGLVRVEQQSSISVVKLTAKGQAEAVNL